MIDLRSDTATKPTQPMREAMATAEVGDDAHGEDPSVNRLQEMSAAMLGKEAALFVTSGTQGNLTGILSHCERGDEYIAGQRAHAYRLEGGGAAVLGSVQPQPLSFEEDGTLDLERVESLIKPPGPAYARTRLLCLENTKGGMTLPLDYLQDAGDLAHRHGLGLHLDGARVFNAAIKHDVPVSKIAHHFDTVTFCLSKGLGAPYGSVLCGSRELIHKARRWRNTLGGGLRQAGIVAAAGIYALDNNIERLADDHANAADLARRLAVIDGLSVDFTDSQTNMVFVTPGRETAGELRNFLEDRGIRISASPQMRLVMHLGVSQKDVHTVADAFSAFYSRSSQPPEPAVSSGP